MEHLAVARSEVRPQAQLGPLIPMHDRPMNWEHLGLSMDLVFPPLKRPAWIELLTAIGALAGLASFALAPILSSWQPLGISLVLFLVVWTAWVISGPLKIHLPRNCTTIRSAVSQIMARNFKRLKSSQHTWNRTDVWQSLVAVIVDQLGVREEQVTYNTRFVDDLGAD
jgi:hypothetical protein